ncbi:MAG: motility associated factor glycosyltransferase family protein [bacterium]|nr:motility associated factor glycosyltransferase family protein [bacterium]
MSTAMPDLRQRALRTNVARLRSRQPALAQAILDADEGGVEVVDGPKGIHTVSDQGTLLASAYDPAREGARLAADMADAPADLLIAVGFGLGHHIEAFRARNPCPVIVYEPKLARLRAALSARPDLKLLDEDDVHLTDDPEELRNLIAARYTSGLRIKVFPHPSLLRLSPDAVREAIERVARVKDSIDLVSNTRRVMMADWARGTIANARHLIGNPSISSLAGSLAGAPAVVCAAGPSLDQQLPKLAAVRDRVIVIAIGQSLRSLRRAGIEPDFVHVVESQDVAHQLTEAGDIGNVQLVLPPQAHPSLFSLPVQQHWVAFQSTNPFGCWIAHQLGERDFLPSSGTVAQCGLHLARVLGCNPVALIGQDLAFTGGRLYADGSAYHDVGFRTLEDGSYEYTNLRGKLEALGRANPQQKMGGELIWVEGWDGDPVPTNKAYASFLDHYRDISPFFAGQGVTLVNCTEGGARIPGLIHSPFQQFLDEYARKRCHVAGVLSEVSNSFLPASVASFDAAFVNVRRELRELDRECGRGLDRARKARREIGRGAEGSRQVELLRLVAKSERKIEKLVSQIMLLDAVVQRELHEVRRELGKLSSVKPDPEMITSEAELLLEATQKAIRRTADLIDILEREITDIE